MQGGTHEAMEIVRLAMPSPTRSRLIREKRLATWIKPSPYKYQPYAVSLDFGVGESAYLKNTRHVSNAQSRRTRSPCARDNNSRRTNAMGGKSKENITSVDGNSAYINIHDHGKETHGTHSKWHQQLIKRIEAVGLGIII